MPRVTTVSGASVTTSKEFNPGGTAKAWVANHQKYGKGVYKEFFPDFVNKQNRARVKFLYEQKLNEKCPAFISPLDYVDDGERLGHFSPLAPGVPLSEMLDPNSSQPTPSLKDALFISLVIVYLVKKLHEMDIVHGDIYHKQFIIEVDGSVYKTSLIDFDNFTCQDPDIPNSLPVAYGAEHFMSKRIFDAWTAKSTDIHHTKDDDMFSLAVLLHQLLLLKHPAQGHDKNYIEEAEVLYGGWQFDPAGGRPAAHGGLSAEILSPHIADLFRQSFNPGKDMPDAAAWENVLLIGLKDETVCKICRKPYIISEEKGGKCPHPGCSHEDMWRPRIILPDGKAIQILKDRAKLGRDELGGNLRISGEKHIEIVRDGKKWYLVSVGRNDDHRIPKKGAPFVLETGKKYIIKPGDQFFLAKVVKITIK